MPPLATYETNLLANQAFYTWIKNLPVKSSGVPVRHDTRGVGPEKIRTANGLLYLPDGIPATTVATLTDVRGKDIALVARQGGVFILPAGLNNGIYVIKAGSARYALAYFNPR